MGFRVRHLWIFGSFAFLGLLSLHLQPALAQPQERIEAKDTDKDGKTDEWRIYEGKDLKRMERDRDGDGFKEVVVFFEKNRAVRATIDRNQDGKPDLFRRYDSLGLPESDDGDLDFDGRIDYWAWYRQGLKWVAAQDRNRDGEPNAFFVYDPPTMQVVGGAIDEDGDGLYERQWGAFPFSFRGTS